MAKQPTIWPWLLGVTVLGIGYVFIDFEAFRRLIGAKAEHIFDNAHTNGGA